MTWANTLTHFNGAIESGDAGWDGLRLWFDTNRNAVTDEGELVTLASQGVDRLNLSFTQVDQTLQGETILARTSTVDGWDDTIGSYIMIAEMGSIYYETDAVDTR